MTEPNPQAEVRRDGPERLLDSAGVSVERMPMLHVIFDRMATQCSESLRQLSTAPAYVTVSSMKTERIGNILESYEGRAVVAVLHAQSWDARVMFGLENRLVFTLVEALYGGDGTEMPYVESRALTNIELRVAQKILDLVARTLQAGFSSVVETRFKFERLESRMDFAVIAPRNNFSVITQINVRVLGRAGELFIVIPQAALTPIRQNLSRDLSNEVSAPDPFWSKKIHSEVGRAEVSVRAVIEERLHSRRYRRPLCRQDPRIAGRRRAAASSSKEIRSRCSGASSGRRKANIHCESTISIDSEQEFLDDLLGR